MNSSDAFETHGRLHIDKGFLPDITSARKLYPPGLLDLMQRLGMSTIGRPVLGMPPNRYAIWYGTIPNEANEIPVVQVGSRNRSPVFSDMWTFGVAMARDVYAEPPFEVLEEYSTAATVQTPAPEHAIANSIYFVAGKSALPKSLHGLITP